jgi:hypothetical protein
VGGERETRDSIMQMRLRAPLEVEGTTPLEPLVEFFPHFALAGWK